MHRALRVAAFVVVSFKEPLHFFYAHTLTQTFTLNSGILDIWLTTFTQTFTLNSGILDIWLTTYHFSMVLQWFSLLSNALQYDSNVKVHARCV